MQSTLGTLHVAVFRWGGLVQSKSFKPGSKITIGPDHKNAFCIPTDGIPDRYPLIHFEKDQTITLNLNDKFTGHLEGNGQRGAISHGPFRIQFEKAVDLAGPTRSKIWKSFFEPQSFRWAVFSTAFHALFLLLLAIFPTHPTELQLIELVQSVPPSVKFDTASFKRFQSSQISALGTAPWPSRNPGQGGRASGEEGKQPKADRCNGILCAFGKETGRNSVLNMILEKSSRLENAYSQLRNFERFGLPGKEGGVGKGLKGFQSGGGGETVSIENGLGKVGQGLGKNGSGIGAMASVHGEERVTAPLEGEMFFRGSLSREAIYKVIQDHLGLIQYCYERALRFDPKLRGKVVVHFVIGMDGTVIVSKVKKTTLQNTTAEGCIQTAIGRLQFDKPRGGTVEVSFPFLFRVAG